jgi:hypothetical protein
MAQAHSKDRDADAAFEGIMVNYVRSAATAKRLIEENGRTVTLVRKTRTAEDPALPWRGPVDPGNTTVAQVKAVIYPVTEKDAIDGLVRLGMETAMVAHDSLTPGQDLSDIDAIIDGSNTYKVVKAVVIGPGDTKIVYQFYLER